MHDLSTNEASNIDQNLEQSLYMAKNGEVLAEQLALDSTRLLSVTADDFDKNRNRGFLKRVWHNLSGQQASIQQSKTDDLLTMQKHSWRYLTHLQQQNCLQADSMIALRNNMLTLSFQEKQTKELVNKMGMVLLEKFRELSDRLSEAETTIKVHSWLTTLESRDYDERFSPRMRLLKIVQDFFKLKTGNWSPDDFFMLQQAIANVDLDRKESLTVKSFVYDLVGEIKNSDFNRYEKLLISTDVIPRNRILDEISSLSYYAVHHTAASYNRSAEHVAILGDTISEEHQKDAIHKLILGELKNEGLRLDAKFKLGDLAIELLHCKRLAYSLGREKQDKIENKKQIISSSEKTGKTTKYVKQPNPEKNTSKSKISSPNKSTAKSAENQYTKQLELLLADVSVIDDNKRRILDRKYQKLGLSKESASKLEKLTIERLHGTTVETLSEKEIKYIDEFKFYLENDGIIDNDERISLSVEQQELGISAERAKELENKIMTESSRHSKNIFTDSELSYINDIKSFLEDGGVINDKEQKLLDNKKKNLGITQERLKELEMHFLFEFRDIISKNSAKPVQKVEEKQKSNTYSKKKTPDIERHVSPLSVQEVVYQFFEKIYKNNDDLYVSDAIPVKKLTNLRKTTEIPVNEGVFAIVDCTHLGSAKDGVAFCQSGIYIHNGWSDTNSGKHFVSWEQFKKIYIENIKVITKNKKNKKGVKEQQLTDDIFIKHDVSIAMLGSSLPITALVQILKKLHNALVEEQLPNDQQKSHADKKLKHICTKNSCGVKATAKLNGKWVCKKHGGV